MRVWLAIIVAIGGALASSAVVRADVLLPYFQTDLNKNPNGGLTSPKTATVKSDVDLYDSPGGTGNVIGMLTKGSQVPFGGCQNDGWCKVTGEGWVWGKYLKH